MATREARTGEVPDDRVTIFDGVSKSTIGKRRAEERTLHHALRIEPPDVAAMPRLLAASAGTDRLVHPAARAGGFGRRAIIALHQKAIEVFSRRKDGRSDRERTAMFAGQRMSEGRGGFADLTGEGAVTGAGGAGGGEGEASTSMMEGGARGREPDARGVADACERAAEATEATGLDGGRAPGAGAEGAREADETGATGREPEGGGGGARGR